MPCIDNSRKLQEKGKTKAGERQDKCTANARDMQEKSQDKTWTGRNMYALEEKGMNMLQKNRNIQKKYKTNQEHT